ncbi:MAG: hypothetical protein MUF43_11525 [Flavobacterium sp.]|jgi:hypothetical protein|nr:hypothetical protein [Flavobacterium sp.]
MEDGRLPDISSNSMEEKALWAINAINFIKIDFKENSLDINNFQLTNEKFLYYMNLCGASGVKLSFEDIQNIMFQFKQLYSQVKTSEELINKLPYSENAKLLCLRILKNESSKIERQNEINSIEIDESEREMLHLYNNLFDQYHKGNVTNSMDPNGIMYKFNRPVYAVWLFGFTGLGFAIGGPIGGLIGFVVGSFVAFVPALLK